MDNFKRHPHNHKRRSLEGFIPPNRGEASSQISFKRAHSYRPQPRIGNFRRPEGYNVDGSNQPVTADGALAISSPSIAPPLAVPAPREGRRKSRVKKHHNWRKIIKRTVLALLAIIILGVGYLFAKGYLNLNKIFKGGANGANALHENVDPSKLRGEGDGRVNILVLGKGGAGHEGPDLTDTLIVASIDPINKEAALISLPRDFYVKVPGYGSMKINEVYANAKNSVLRGKKTNDQAARAEKTGLETVQKVVENTIGIPIHYYAMVDFEGFRKAIDTVGGIDMNVPENLAVYEVMRINGKNYTLNVKAGQQQFDGFRALAFARSRKTSPRGDFDRSERQRLVILSLKDKVLSAGTFSNPLRLNRLIDDFGNRIQTNLSLDEVRRVYDITKDIPGSQVKSLGLAAPPNVLVKTTTMGGLSVVVPRLGTYDYSEVQSFVRNNLRDGFLKKENARVAILNGTNSSGLAAKKSEELKSYGYNVGNVGDAPTKNYAKTVLVDLRGGKNKYTKRYLEQRFKTSAVSNLPDGSIMPGDADFVIILGQNETTSGQN